MGCCELKNESNQNVFIINSDEDENENDYQCQLDINTNNNQVKLSDNYTVKSSVREFKIEKNNITTNRGIAGYSIISGNKNINTKTLLVSNNKEESILNGINFDKYKHIFSARPIYPNYKSRKTKKSKINI